MKLVRPDLQADVGGETHPDRQAEDQAGACAEKKKGPAGRQQIN
jgi:hypothetical protein